MLRCTKLIDLKEQKSWCIKVKNQHSFQLLETLNMSIFHNNHQWRKRIRWHFFVSLHARVCRFD
ncbi:uncharacterized protein DS421_1g06850 [Arachis hypogaea]|nr:uncharacterized protein DS421_1g06850 [Arachis hypogaea]